MLSHTFTDTLYSDSANPLADVSQGDWRSLMVLAVLVALLATEARWAREDRRRSEYRQSYLANFGLLFFNDTLLSLLSVASLWTVASRFSGWGLLAGMDAAGGKALLSFVLLDFTLYGWHRACHQLDCFWLFHKVHHSDRVMNVSTGFRLHVMEVLLTVLVKAAFIILVGVDAHLLVVNEALITLCILFHHANIRFCGEQLLGKLAITPSLHRTHHSTRRQEHDNNYGAVLTCWDRLFGTLCDTQPQNIGLPGVPGLSFWDLLQFGLSSPLPSKPKTVAAGSVVPLHQMIAEAAYYRAEKRGFQPGNDFLDWLEAEREFRDWHPQA
jgi:sterol desaturase/sphingolipid hydroxylase (fatty acid hydroxylase superfamily)